MAYFLYIQGRQNRTYKEILTRSMARPPFFRLPPSHAPTNVLFMRNPRRLRSRLALFSRMLEGPARKRAGNRTGARQRTPKACAKGHIAQKHAHASQSTLFMRQSAGVMSRRTFPRPVLQAQHLRTRKARVSGRGTWCPRRTLRGTLHLSPARGIVSTWF